MNMHEANYQSLFQFRSCGTFVVSVFLVLYQPHMTHFIARSIKKLLLQPTVHRGSDTSVFLILRILPELASDNEFNILSNEFNILSTCIL